MNSCFYHKMNFLGPQNVVGTTEAFLVTDERFVKRLKDYPVRQSSNVKLCDKNKVEIPIITSSILMRVLMENW